MLELDSTNMQKEIDALQIRVEALKDKLRESGKYFDADQAAVDRIEEHKNQLASRLSGAVRADAWNSIRSDFLADWNSVVVDLELLEKRLYE